MFLFTRLFAERAAVYVNDAVLYPRLAFDLNLLTAAHNDLPPADLGN